MYESNKVVNGSSQNGGNIFGENLCVMNRPPPVVYNITLSHKYSDSYAFFVNLKVLKRLFVGNCEMELLILTVRYANSVTTYLLIYLKQK